MKVAYIGQPWNPIRPNIDSGSIAIWTDQVARRLPRSVDAVLYGRRGRSEPRVITHENLEYRRFPTGVERRMFDRYARLRARIGAPGPPFTWRSYYGAYLARVAMDLRRRKADIIHIHNIAQFAPALRRVSPRSKFVLHMHCEWLSTLEEPFVSRCLRAVDCVVGCSEHITGKIVERFPDISGRCTTVYNGVDVSIFGDAHDQADHAEHTILYVGRVAPEKGIHVLVQAFNTVARRDPRAVLRIVGPYAQPEKDFVKHLGDEAVVEHILPWLEGDYMERLHSAIEAPARDRVVFAGPAPHQSLPASFHDASVVVNPSLSDAFPMGVVEAMASGAPVVATRVGGVVEMLEGGAGLLVRADDPDALAEAILRELGSESLRESLAGAATARVAERFTWERIAESVHDLYEGLLRR